MNNKLPGKIMRIGAILLCVVMVVTYMPMLPGTEYSGSTYALTDDAIDVPSDGGIEEGDVEDPDENTSGSAVSGSSVKANGTSGIKVLGVDDDVDTSWYTGNEKADLYELEDDKDLRGLSELVNNGIDFKGKTIKFKSKLELSEFTIQPIGSSEKPFAGEFDGNGTSLNDLKIIVERNDYIGLFGYTTSDSSIRNLDLDGGNLIVSEKNTTTGKQIRYVGAIVGYMNGDIENCSSSMNVSVSSNMTLDENKGIIRNVGGIAGYTNGNISECTNSGDIFISSQSNINEKVTYLVGEIGGIAGAQGDVNNVTELPKTVNCTNTGELKYDITGKGGIDRFGAQLYSVAFAAGGIIGQASGIIENCKNDAVLYTSNNDNGSPEKGRGATNTGGIVGSLRGFDFEYASSESAQNANFSNIDPAYQHYMDYIDNKIDTLPKTAGVYNCVNTSNATIIGLAAIGGIVGNGGTFTEIEGCSNSADIKGCRWNKPFAAGIVGNTQGDIRYCYNRGNIFSVTGGGYYCAGIAGGIWVPYTSNTADKYKISPTVMTGCYTTGQIYTDSKGYKTGILAGENEGFIHDNVYLSTISTKDGNQLVDSDTGTTKDNTSLSASNLKGSKGCSLLNVHAAGGGNWKSFYIPDKGNINNGYPVLSDENKFSVDGAHDISGDDATLECTSDASYSATGGATPIISVTLSNGTILTQNADFYVKTKTDDKDVTIGVDGTEDSRPYSATVIGMGNYAGTLSETVKYGIKKAEISSCSVVADPVTFNWRLQRPNKTNVKVIDSVGNEVNNKEYEVGDLYDPSKGTNGYNESNTSVMDIHYYDYTNVHTSTYKYDVCIKANDSSSNYTGSTTQQVFRIHWVSMSAELPSTHPAYDPNKTESVLYGDVIWQGKKWDFIKAMDDTSGDSIKITYTGKPIKPTVTSVTYKGQNLRLAKGIEYIDSPLDYDYKYIYGNPNPETTGGSSTDPINVTANQPTCMTVRFTNGGNFDNYVNIFFKIMPAAINSASMKIADKQYTGKNLTPKPSITYNGATLKDGKDYILTGIKHNSNKSIGKATVKFTIKGKGNFSEVYSKTITYKIVPTKTKISKLTALKKSMKVTFKKVSKKQAVTSYQIRYRVKGTAKWKIKTIKAGKSNLTVKSLKKGKKYQVQVRVVKKIKKGTSKGTYYSPWSSTKTSAKIK